MQIHTNITVHWYEKCLLIWVYELSFRQRVAIQSQQSKEICIDAAEVKVLSKPQSWHQPGVRLFISALERYNMNQAVTRLTKM